MRYDKLRLKAANNKKSMRQCLSKGIVDKNYFKIKGFVKRQNRKAERAEGKNLAKEVE
jgi:hypothetical protein